MIQKIASNLEDFSKTVKSSSSPKQVEDELKALRVLIKNFSSTNGQLEKVLALDQELATWQSKLSVILKEPIGRQGMAKHALYWAESLRKI